MSLNDYRTRLTQGQTDTAFYRSGLDKWNEQQFYFSNRKKVMKCSTQGKETKAKDFNEWQLLTVNPEESCLKVVFIKENF